jgi:flagella basal body P-ring formation protein FlgA
VRIALSANVGVGRPDVTLGDIASMSTPELETLKRLMALPLGPAPRAGESAQLRRADLMRWIQQRTGLDARRIVWEGASVTELHRASAEIPGARLTAVANESLRAWLAGHTSRADVAVTAMPRDVAVPFGQTSLAARPIPQDAQPAKRMVVWVDIWVEGRFVRTVPVGFDVAAYGPAYVTDGDMPLGAGFDPSALKAREVELTGRAIPVLAPSAAVSASGAAKQMRRPVPAGKALTSQDVEDRPAVARGDWVALRVRSGAIEMESRVEALQSGRVGQDVSVRPSKSSDPILARVVAPGKVEVTQ